MPWVKRTASCIPGEGAHAQQRHGLKHMASHVPAEGARAPQRHGMPPTPCCVQWEPEPSMPSDLCPHQEGIGMLSMQPHMLIAVTRSISAALLDHSCTQRRLRCHAPGVSVKVILCFFVEQQWTFRSSVELRFLSALRLYTT
eukprot:1158434-Pelagomonas_calceolata.AAC.5